MDQPPGLSFPLSMRLRVIGRNADDFPSLVVELVGRHILQMDAQDISLRPSRDGNYISVELPIFVENREQYEAVYRELNAHESVIIVL